MAASFSVTIQCTICGTAVAITNVTEAAKGSVETKETRYQCATCGVAFPFVFTIIEATHTGDIGSFQTLTHTLATPGSIASAASNAA